MATGVPVVTTTGGAIPEVVGQAAVTVTPGDVQELAAAISGPSENEKSRRALIASGLERSRKFAGNCTRNAGAIYIHDLSGELAQ